MNKMTEKKNKPKATIFIDDANMFFAQKNMGWFIDWKKIYGCFSKKYQITSARYYAGVNKNEPKRQKYFAKLRSNGYMVIAKPLKKIYLEKDKFMYKANVDVEITADLVFERDEYDVAILFSGDSDFEYVIKKLQKIDKKIVVCAPNRGLSIELRRTANEIVLIGQIRREIELKKDPPHRSEGIPFTI